MDPKIFSFPIDLDKQIISNAKENPLTTAQRLALGLTLTTNDEGLVVFDTDIDAPFHWLGAAWKIDGRERFIDLTDTPANYTAQATKYLRVNSAENAVEFITIGIASSSVTGFLSNTDWSLFNSKQAALNGTGFVKITGTTISYDNSAYLTTISGIAAGGELSGTYPNPSLVTSAVTGKLLSGLNITGGTIAATDSILIAFGKVQSQISAMLGGVTYQGTWNATTNTPTLVSSTGTKGQYYVVSVAGATNINGITDWKVGDWIIFNGSVWDKVDNTDAVSSVNGFTGAVSLTTANVSESGNLYFTNPRAIGATLTGYTSSAGTISSADTILSAIQKLNGNIAAISIPVSSVFGRTGAVVAVSGDYTTAQVTESGNLYYTNARGIASTLTGYTSGAGTISSADTILSAIQKLNGNDAAISTAYVNNTTDATLTRSGSGPYTLGLNLANANTWTGIQTITVAGTINTFYEGIILQNTGTSTLSNPQQSPALHFKTSGTSSSSVTGPVEVRVSLSSQSVAQASAALNWEYSSNGSAWFKFLSFNASTATNGQPVIAITSPGNRTLVTQGSSVQMSAASGVHDLILGDDSSAYFALRTNATASTLSIRNYSGSSDLVTWTRSNGNMVSIGTITATQIIRTSGTSGQFLKADGSVDTNTYLTTALAGTTYVPYTGATGNIDIGVNSFRCAAIEMKGPTPSNTAAYTAPYYDFVNNANDQSCLIQMGPTSEMNFFNYNVSFGGQRRNLYIDNTGQLYYLFATNTPTSFVMYFDTTTKKISYGAVPTGSVTTVSVVSANGFAGTVATATSTPAITITTSITGIIKGNGTAISAAVAGTDYQVPISLTTTGTSGAATFIAGVLNIPNYASGGSPFASDILVNSLTVGRGNGSGASNTAFGVTALNASTASTASTAIGYESLKLATSGLRNTGLGIGTLQAITTQGDNTALGAYAMQIGTSSSSVGIGSFALQYTNSANSIGIGYCAGQQGQVGNGVFIGYLAGQIMGGSGHVVIGYQSGIAGGTPGTVSNLTLIGASTDFSASTTITNSTAIGYQATVTASNQMKFGNASVTSNIFSGNISAATFNSVNISNNGVATAVSVGTVSGSGYVKAVTLGNATNIYGDNSIAIGYGASTGSHSSSTTNMVVGYLATITASSMYAQNNTLLGPNTALNADTIGVPVLNSTAIGYQAAITASNQMVFGNSSITSNVFKGALSTTGAITGAAFNTVSASSASLPISTWTTIYTMTSGSSGIYLIMISIDNDNSGWNAFAMIYTTGNASRVISLTTHNGSCVSLQTSGLAIQAMQICSGTVSIPFRVIKIA